MPKAWWRTAACVTRYWPNRHRPQALPAETAVPPASLGSWRTPLHRPVADAASVDRAAKALLSAAKVVIVAGDGAALSGCGAELLAVAEALQAPIDTSLGARGIVPGCLDLMWAEGPGPFESHGHYVNMTNPAYGEVACGFYTTPGGDVWAVQDFR